MDLLILFYRKTPDVFHGYFIVGFDTNFNHNQSCPLEQMRKLSIYVVEMGLYNELELATSLDYLFAKLNGVLSIQREDWIPEQEQRGAEAFLQVDHLVYDSLR